MEQLASIATDAKASATRLFRSCEVPLISLARYAQRLDTFMGCSPESFVLALVYVDRARKAGVSMEARTLHRLLGSALVLAAKTQDDHFYSNAYYAKVIGIRCKELNAIELELLKLLDFRLFVDAHDYECYRRLVCQLVAPVHSAL